MSFVFNATPELIAGQLQDIAFHTWSDQFVQDLMFEWCGEEFHILQVHTHRNTMFPGLHVGGQLESAICHGLKADLVFGNATFQIRRLWELIQIDIWQCVGDCLLEKVIQGVIIIIIVVLVVVVLVTVVQDLSGC